MVKRKEPWSDPAAARGCDRKQRYASSAEAKARGRHSLTFQRNECLWVYKCPHCKGWHLTSRPQDPKNAVNVTKA